MNYEKPLSMAGAADPGAFFLRGIVSGRPMFASVDIDLQEGQQVLADGGSLLWMEGGMAMETECVNGLLASIGRCCAGEACCLNRYTGPGKISLGFPLPGDMMCFAVGPGAGWILSKGAFVAGSNNIYISARFSGFCASVFSGEGPFLTHVTCKDGQGMFYAGGFGSITRHDIAAGQVFIVDHGLFFAAHEATRLHVAPIGGIKSTLCSGEGIVMRFNGPCTIFTQSRDPALFNPSPEPAQIGEAQPFGM